MTIATLNCLKESYLVFYRDEYQDNCSVLGLFAPFWENLAIASPMTGARAGVSCTFTIYCAATSQEFPTNSNRSPRLLIVDDSPVALAFLDAVFRGAQYEVETASNGVEGLDKALRNVPDLIVTDGLMPDVDGFELVRRLRNHPETAQVPVVMLTSVDTLDPEFSGRIPQPDAMVAKSMQIEPLMDKVKALLAKSVG